MERGPTGRSGVVVYGEEVDCDVIFQVGQLSDETWRLPAHKDVLSRSNPVFCAMFSENFVPLINEAPHKIRVPDVDGRAFDNLLRFLYNEPASIQSVETALNTLYCAHKYLCPGLVHFCTEYLTRNLGENSVLSILKFVRVLSGGEIQNLENIQREMELKHKRGEGERRNSGEGKRNLASSNSGNLNSIEVDCASLLSKCLLLIDQQGERIVCSEEMEDLDIETIRVILSRDGLSVPSEDFVFNAILKWADKECKRKQLPLTSTSKRAVLGETLFLPRYLTMSLTEFENGPAQSGLFTFEEFQILRKSIINGGMPPKRSPSRGGTPTPSAPPLTPPSSTPPPNDHPLSLISPHLESMSHPRNSCTNILPKKSRFQLLDKWLTLKNNGKCCCKSGVKPHFNRTLTSPIRKNSRGLMMEDGKKRGRKVNSFIEHAVICFACLFD